MIEIFFIPLQLIIFFLIFSFPFNRFIIENTKLKIEYNFFNFLIYNLIIHFGFYLILSFFYFNLNKIFLIEILIGIFFLIINLRYYIHQKKLNHKLFRYIILFFFINIFIFFNIANNLKLEWDAFHWIYKTNIYMQNGSYKDIAHVPLSYYPHLGTYLWAYFWSNSFLELEYFGRLIFPFIYISGLFFLISDFLNKKKSYLYFLILLFIIFITIDFYLFGGYQDYLIFFEMLVISKFIYEIYENKNILLNIILSIICLSLILWTKQEGFFYFLILSLIILVSLNFKKKIYLSLTLLSILIGSYYIKKILIGSFDFNEPIFNEGLLRYLDPTILLNTFLIIIKHFVISFFKYPIWIVIFITYTYLMVKNYNFPKFLHYYLILFFLLIFAIYFHTSVDLNFLASVTMDRLLLQGSGFFIFPILKVLISNEKF